MNWDKAFGGLFAGLLVILGIMVAVAPIRSSSAARRVDLVLAEMTSMSSALTAMRAELGMVRRELAATRAELAVRQLAADVAPQVLQLPSAAADAIPQPEDGAVARNAPAVAATRPGSAAAKTTAR